MPASRTNGTALTKRSVFEGESQSIYETKPRPKPQNRQASLLSTIAQVANLLLRSQDYTSVLSDVAQLLGEAVECDHCTITQEIEMSDYQQAVRLLTQWCQADVPSDSAATPDFSVGVGVNQLADFQARLLRGEVVNFLVSDLPEGR